MYGKLLVPSLLSVALLAGPAFAATGGNAKPAPVSPAKPAIHYVALNPTQKCNVLEKQFDMAFKTHDKAAKAADARVMRADGGSLCASGKQTAGVQKLEQALQEIGVAPQS